MFLLLQIEKVFIVIFSRLRDSVRVSFFSIMHSLEKLTYPTQKGGGEPFKTK